MLITVNGLVVRSYRSGNSDRVIHILSEDHGRLTVMIKGGASKRGAASASCTQLFTYGNYELYQKREGDMCWFRGGSVLTPFYELSENITSMALATYMCDVAADLTPEGTDETNGHMLLTDLLNSLYVLSQETKSPTLVKAVFEFRAASIMGFCPDLWGCSLCGDPNPENAYLEVASGRLICADCQTKRNRIRDVANGEEALRGGNALCPISSSVLAALRFLLEVPPKRIFSFSLKDGEEERFLERATETYLLSQMEREFETLHFYRSVTI